jgi:hypothetical protein
MKYKNWLEYVAEAGQEAGKLELGRITIKQALDYLKSRNFDVSAIPNFEKNFLYAQKMSHLGKTQRKDMPVIDSKDVKDFQRRLETGRVDIHKPFSAKEKERNPFPTGLSGKDAEKWLEAGLYDGDHEDDKIDVKQTHKKIKELKPIQKQIYFDVAMEGVILFGVAGVEPFMKNKSSFITSSDNFIIDGHHRWAQALIVNPDMSVNTLSIDLPINKLLPMSLAYGDAVGNARNL